MAQRCALCGKGPQFGQNIRHVHSGSWALRAPRTKRRWLRGGEEQHHLIDPATGRPSQSPWDEVTVCGSSCLAADVAAKAAFLHGDDGPDWLDERGLPGRFLAGGRAHENDSWLAQDARVA